MQPSCARGFTIVEAVVALAIVTSAVFTLVTLTRQVTDTVARSRRHLIGAVLADAFVSTRLGLPPAVTPADCLDRDVAGCVELLDGGGRPTMAAPVFVRRWRIQPVPGAPSPAWTLAVCVVPAEQRATPWLQAGACVSRIVAVVAP